MTPDEARQRAVEAAGDAILANLSDRRGIKQALWEIDADVMAELRDTLGQIAMDAAEASLWQTIETAPRDGTIVMGWTGTRLFIGQWFDGAAGFAGVSGALIDGARGRWIACTHWRPLPTEPGDGS